jgi:hypothetical protein
MRNPPRRAAGGSWQTPPDCSRDESEESTLGQTDPESLAKEVTKPIIDAIRKELEKVDVSKPKQ